MKKVTINALHKGDAFTVAGHEYIVLDHYGGGILALESNTLDCRAFGKNNDWRTSAVREYLNGEYLDELADGGIDPDADLLTLNIDLKATDGSRQYGYDSCKVGMLTLEQYTRYSEYIPLADDPWWLATPWGIPEGRSPRTFSSTYAWYISTSGYGSYYNTSSTDYGPRPALIFNPSLLVEVESGDSVTETDLDNLGKILAEKLCAELPANAFAAFLDALADKFRGVL